MTKATRHVIGAQIVGFVESMLDAGELPDRHRGRALELIRRYDDAQDNISEAELDAQLAAVSDVITEALSC